MFHAGRMKLVAIRKLLAGFRIFAKLPECGRLSILFNLNVAMIWNN